MPSAGRLQTGGPLYPGNLTWVGGVSVGTIDREVLGFTVLVTVITAVLAGLFPALHASGFDLNLALKESSTRSGSGARQGRIRSVLVGAEIALALVLLVGAALLARTFLALRAVDPGFDPPQRADAAHVARRPRSYPDRRSRATRA